MQQIAAFFKIFSEKDATIPHNRLVVFHTGKKLVFIRRKILFTSLYSSSTMQLLTLMIQYGQRLSLYLMSGNSD